MRKEQDTKTVVDHLFDEVFRIDCKELDDEYWDVERVIERELHTVFEEFDDLGFSAWASVNTYDYKEPTIHGELRFCVYGGISYEELAKKLEKAKFKFLTITDVWHPQQTIGISMDGIYEDEDTTYIGATYKIER